MDVLLTFSLFAFALILGIKHSFDADHLVAVSSLLTRSPTIKNTTGLSISWALGHMATASIITIILFTFKETLFKDFLANLDILVPVMLIFIAILTIAFEFNLIHFHRHKHTDNDTNIEKEHTHIHTHILGSKRKDHSAMIGIGFIHGIASNDELLLLLTLTFGFQDLTGILMGVGVFTLGVIIGMIAYAISINYPIQKWGTKRVTRTVNLSIAGISMFYAIWLLAGIDGLNIFEMFSLNL
ncbi:MAG: hypothetical protein ACW98A_10175 [Candidatus Hodarchaeales archaeon]|jgi:high-affinity nickel permease